MLSGSGWSGELQEKLALTYAENLGATAGACTLSSRAPVLEGHRLRIFDFNLFPALHAIRLHIRTSYVSCQAE
jgi:hypothetical protein